MNEIFLTEAQVDELTGIKRGHTLHLRTKPEKLTKYQRQAEFLRNESFAFFVNVRGRPIVTRAAIEGRPEPVRPVTEWQSAVLA